jgi:hypothetical protein
MLDWPEFEACIRAKIERILQRDPHNIKRLSNILALEKLILDERFKLLTLVQKYLQSQPAVPLPLQAETGYQWN